MTMPETGLLTLRVIAKGLDKTMDNVEGALNKPRHFRPI
jgi:hypothetical protein